MDRVNSARAVAAGRARKQLDAAIAFKNRWHNWLYNNPPNISLLVSNVLYLALCFATLILTVLIMHEHADDFKRNSLTNFRGPSHANTPPEKVPKPCGIPTPDGMYLLQALGNVAGAGWDGAALEPNYQSWMKTIDRALCSKLIPGVDAPDQGSNAGVCDPVSDHYGLNYVEELLTIGYLMDDANIMPNDGDFSDSTAIDAKATVLEELACITDHNSAAGEEPFYSTQQYDSYGDLKSRVARAYITAMPGFSRFEKEHQACQSADLGHEDPFDTRCKHACHIKEELKAAAADQHAMHDENHVYEKSFTKQLYRLLALSLAGYYDRYHNNGQCFRNGLNPTSGVENTALELCVEAMDDVSPGSSGDAAKTQTEAYALFAAQNDAVRTDARCGETTDISPPPAPPVFRTEHTDAVTGAAPVDGNNKELRAAQVCASTLEYGLIEQGRLFGIPDVITPFVVDSRVHRSFHFIATWIYNGLYKDPEKKAGQTFADPKAKLELYIAYRLASSSIWAIMVANVAGYMMVRALVPGFVSILKFAGVTSGVLIRKTINGVTQPTGEFEAIKLRRPKVEKVLFAVIFTTVLVVYWIMWLDPATQSHYYITTTCEDWAGLGVHVPSGAYMTTWGKRRFDRFGEHLIGILLILTIGVFVVQQTLGRTFVAPGAKAEQSAIKPGTVSRKQVVAWVMIGLALVTQLCFWIQSIVSGQKWFDGAKSDDDTKEEGEVYTKDVLMSVWAAFWNAAAIAWYRQKWCITDLKAVYQYAWMAASALLVWMPVFQASALLSDEIDEAFQNGKGTKDTERLVLYILILAFTSLWTGVLVFKLKGVWNGIPSRGGGAADRSAGKIAMAKQSALKKIARARAAVNRFTNTNSMTAPAEGSSASGFKFDLSRVHVAPEAQRPPRKAFAVSGHPAAFFAQRLSPSDEYRSVHMPLMPK